MSFEPIAIVGRSCLFPGGFTPGQLWKHIEAGTDLIRPAPPERLGVPLDAVLTSLQDRRPESIFTDRGGFVEGFDQIFDPIGFAIGPEEIRPLDDLHRWGLHTGREALRDAGIDAPSATPARTGAVFGLLEMGTDRSIEFAQSVWLRKPVTVDPRNRFGGGLAAHIIARALRLDRGAFALDAACASSIYAIKLACDALHDGTADIMLAGAVSRTDALYLQIGFCTLSAASPTGRSRPFASDADGLLPAEGASFVVMKRLADARRAGDRIYGVIRGVGIGNDGRTASLMAPSASGQADTLRSAYVSAGLEPAQISLIECHATGTPIGDLCEIRSTGRVFSGLKNIPIGSVKSNLGHPMTAAGMAGLLKILGAMETKTLPRMLHVNGPSSQIEQIASSPFRLICENERWETQAPRRAALSAFGFGGNNAHMIVEEWTGSFPSNPLPRESGAVSPIAVIAVGACVGSAADSTALSRALFAGETIDPKARWIDLPFEDLGFPPHDLEDSLPYQIMALRAADEALSKIGALPSKTGVFIGAGMDPEVSRPTLHFRNLLPESHPRVCPPITAAAIIGRLGNTIANRISSKHNLRGVSLAVFSEEISGLTAFDLACRALRRREIDVAIVGASDLSCEPVHEAAMAALLPERAGKPLDAAVFLVLKRAQDAGAAADPMLAIVGEPSSQTACATLPSFGYSHRAHGLLEAVKAVLCCAHQALGPGRPWIGKERIGNERAQQLTVKVNALGGASATACFQALPDRMPEPLVPPNAPRVYVYAGAGRQALVNALRAGRESDQGRSRLAIVAANAAELSRKRDLALSYLESKQRTFAVDGIWYREQPVEGEIAFVFPGAAAAYQGAGGSLLMAFPETLANVRQWAPRFVWLAEWLFASADSRATPANRLWACTALTQCHVHLTRRMLGVRADAAIGMSSGETNALFAFEVWRDADLFGRDTVQSELFQRHLGGSFDVLGGATWETFLFSIADHEMRHIAAAEPALRILAIHMPGEYLTAGDPATMQRAIRIAGAARVQRVDFDLVVHAPEAAPFSDAWRRLHHRETWSPPDGTRFYQMAGARVFDVNRDSVADSLTAQVLQTLDFPRLIEAAWNDGVRIFLEHGPRGGCSTWIRRILKDREHLAIPLDLPGVDSLSQAAHAIAQLFVAGIPVDYALYNRRTTPELKAKARVLRLPAHLPPIEPPAIKPAAQAQQPARSSLFKLHASALANSWEDYLTHASQAFQTVLQTHRPPNLPAPVSPLPVRPKFTREDLEKTASGRISEVFGPLFAPLDHYRRIVRLPMPPMLLADRIVSLDAEPATMGIGSLVAETDIVAGAWYLHRGRMPAGIVIESGQADMLLISWLGIDFIVKGERIYRLLGCDLTYHAEMPGPGSTLRYHIRITGHARQGDVRIFFFEYDCHVGGQLIAAVRNAQAGFFTDEELRDSAGILWNPEDTTPDANVHIPAPRFPDLPKSFSREQLRAAADGDAYSCFGAGFEFSAAQQRPPSFGSGKLLLVDTISDLDLHGGPWRRGYLRAEYPVEPNNWLFACHFKDDPCLPGTLMFEGAIQCMAFYLMALGYTLERDGWRFEPVPGAAYPLRCRGQITPESKLMVCEIFVEGIVEGPEPALYAHVLGSVDGLKAFHCRGMAVRLAPGNPLDEQPAPPPEACAVAEVNGVRLDSNAMLACALGSASRSFGPPYAARFEKYERSPRLPAPPYMFMSRITRLEGRFGVESPGTAIDADFDLTPGAWYFASGSMAFAALLEVGLQPCGWISCFSGIPLRAPSELYFRNLDGDAVIHGRVPELAGILKTRAVLTGVSRSGPVTLTAFHVTVSLGGRPVLEMKTGFGFFRKEDLAGQAGLPPTPGELRDAGLVSGTAIDLSERPSRFFEGPLRLPDNNLLMIDRITGMGPAFIRAERSVRPGDWYFKAHFYTDPVQPGSLGIEAILQTARCFAIDADLAEGFENPRIEFVGPIVWKYRGQVLPLNSAIRTEVAVRKTRRENDTVELDCEGWLWTDGARIYHVPKFTLRISPAGNPSCR